MINLSSLNKGLVFHSRLAAENQKVGSELITAQNNRDFSGGTIGDWLWNSPDSGTGVVTYSADSPIVGDKCAKLTTTDARYIRGILLSNYTSGFVEGRTYRLTMSVYLVSGHSYESVALGASSMDYTVVTSSNVDLALVDQWQKVYFDFHVDGSDVVGYCYVQTNGGAVKAANGEFIYFDEVSIKPLSIADLTPYGNHCSNYGVTFTTDRKGQADRAGDFDGAEYLNSASNSPFDMGSDNFTVGLWFKTSTDYSGAYGRLFIYGESGGAGDKSYSLAITNGNLGLIWIDDDTAGKSVSSTSTLNDGSWHFMVGVRDGNNLRLYIDGAADANSPTDITGYGDLDSAGDGIQIGADNVAGSPSNYFTGQIDEVRIYNRALSADEVLALYNSYRSNLEIT